MAKEETPKESGKGPSDTTPTIPEGEITLPPPTTIKLSAHMESEDTAP